MRKGCLYSLLYSAYLFGVMGVPCNFTLVSHLCCLFIYTQTHHGKGPVDKNSGTIKNKVFQKVKSGRIVIGSPIDFTMHTSYLIQSITMLYLPKKDLFNELASIENALYIKGTLDVHKVKKKRNDQGMFFSELYCLSFDEKWFYTHFYWRSSDLIICGHESFEGGPNRCPQYLNNYHVGEEHMECPM